MATERSLGDVAIASDSASARARIYRPRMIARLWMPVIGTAQKKIDKEKDNGDEEAGYFPVRLRRARIESNDHNHADACNVSMEWRDAGSDPRLMRNAVAEIYMGSADDRGQWNPTRNDLRFIGVAARAQRIGDGESGLRMEVEFLDYTILFIEATPFGTLGIPDLSVTLSEAWRRIVSQTPGADVLADRLVFEGDAEDAIIGKGVAERFRKLAKVPTKPNTDAWAVWQQCVGMLGLISFIRLDECVVTTATDYYSSGNPTKMVWGRNILDMKEARNQLRSGKGIGITSYDPFTHTALEALWPPVGGDNGVKHKKVSAKKAGDEAVVRQSEEREYFAVPFVTDMSVLLDIAKRVHAERSRQELEGTIVTNDMTGETVSGDDADLMSLVAGEVIRVEFEQQDKEALAAIQTIDGRVDYLVARGYARNFAQVMAENVSDLITLQPHMHVKRVTTTLDVESDPGNFEVEISYCNKIAVDGSATAESSANPNVGHSSSQTRPRR